MNTEMFNAESVISLIEKAFPDGTFPDDKKVIYDGGMKYEDSAMTAVYFKGKSWKEFKPDFLRKYSDSLHFFSSDAYAFFLPAFLMAIIKAYDEVDALVETVVNTLTPPQDKDSKYDIDRFTARTKQFSHDQKKVIATFLSYIKNVHEFSLKKNKQKVLDSYWDKFL